MNGMSELIKAHLPCDKCGSSDALAIYDDHKHCYSCGYHASNDMEDTADAVSVKGRSPASEALKVQQSYRPIPERGISSATTRFYSVHVTDEQHSYPYTDANGSVIAHKYRQLAEKTFRSDGVLKEALLFGQNLFSAGGKYVTITEGELDALAAFQMLGSKYPVLSIKNGAQSALRDCKKQFEYLDSFDNIIISFDNDAPGKQAAKEVAELFGSKSKIITLSKYKDACDYLAKGDTKPYIEQWWAAERYVMDGIVAGSSLWGKVNTPPEQASCQYPWEGLNDLTYGIRMSELVTITAGSGLGKSQVLREIIYHILKNTEANIGVMMLEESVTKTAKSIMSLYANKPLHIPDTTITEAEMREAFEATLGTDRLFLWDHFGSNSIESVINRIKYMAKALDCKFIVLDHISLIVSSQENGANERQVIDELMTKLRTTVQETGIALLCVSHLRRPEGNKGHEEGAATSMAQLRGSASIGQLSDMVIGLERHAQAEDERERNTTHVRLLKNRAYGLTGECCSLYYDRVTGRLSEFTGEDL